MQLGRNLVHVMRCSSVLSSFLQYFIFCVATSHEITIHANVPATKYLCHFAAPFVVKLNWLGGIMVCKVMLTLTAEPVNRRMANIFCLTDCTFPANPPTVAAGTPVTLSWGTTGASYIVVSPQVGAVRGTNVTVTPAQTTTYALSATNQYGCSTATLTVTAQ